MKIVFFPSFLCIKFLSIKQYVNKLDGSQLNSFYSNIRKIGLINHSHGCGGEKSEATPPCCKAHDTSEYIHGENLQKRKKNVIENYKNIKFYLYSCRYLF